MDCSMPDFPVLHYLPEFAQTHVHWVDGAIQPSLLDLIHSGLSVLYDIGESCWIQVNLLCQWEMRCLWYWQEREARFICTFNKYLLNVCIVLYIKGSKIVTAITELSKIKKRKAREPGEWDADGEGGQGGEGPDQFLSSVCGTAEEDLEKTETLT